MVPKIRFKGFEGEWEEKRLNTFAKRITRKNSNLETSLPLTISAQYGLIDQSEFFEKRVASENLANYYVIRKGEFAYNKSTSGDAPWGAVKRLDRYENGALSTLYIAFGLKDTVDSNYIVSYYETSLWHRYIQAIAAEGARNHGLLNVPVDDFFKMEIPMPKDIKEQSRIGDCFAHIDFLITLHQNKLDQQKKLKQYFLQNMFPAKGEKVPRIRFKGFSGDWEEKKLGDIAKIITGKTPPTNDRNNYDGEYLFVSPADIQSNRYIENTLTTLSEKGFLTGRCLRPGTSLFVCIGSTIGKVAQTKSVAVTNQQINGVVPNSNMDDNFVFSMLERLSENIKCLAGAQAVPILNKSTFESVDVFYSNKDEQKHIGNFFKSIDTTITLEQQKITQLQSFKKFMLQNMFV